MTLLRIIFQKPKYNKQFNFGISRYASILHSRLRLKCSALNEHLFCMNCIPYPQCVCGYHTETIVHYLCYCPRYAAQRTTLFASVGPTIRLTVTVCNDAAVSDILLRGSNSLSYEQNVKLFTAVQKFVLDSTNINLSFLFSRVQP